MRRATITAEWMKYPPMISIGLVCALPLGIVGLKTLGFLMRQESLVAKQRYHWAAFVQAGHFEWSHMLVPLTLASWAVYVCWLENEGNTWKTLLVQPHGRCATFWAKSTLLATWLVLFFALNTVGHCIAGNLLFPEQNTPLGSLLAFNAWSLLFAAPVLAGQFWLATRFSHPMASLAICLAGNLIAMTGSGLWLRLLPWHYTGHIGALAPEPGLVASCVGICLLLVWFSFWDFARKDIL